MTITRIANVRRASQILNEEIQMQQELKDDKTTKDIDRKEK